MLDTLIKFAPYFVLVLSALVVPGVIALVSRIMANSKMAAGVRLKQAIHEELKPLIEQQQKQHQENRDFLDTIRTEAFEREARMMNAVEGVREQLRDDRKDLDRRIDGLGSRVDDIARLAGDRRR